MRSSSCTAHLYRKKSFHQETLRVQVSLWHSALRFKDAELHQQLLRLFVLLALVVSSVMGQEDTASPEDPSTSDSVVVLCFAIPKGRAASAQNPARFLTCSWRSRAWSTIPPISTRWHETPLESFYILLRISANAETSIGMGTQTIGKLDLEFPCSLPGPQSGPLVASRFRLLRW